MKAPVNMPPSDRAAANAADSGTAPTLNISQAAVSGMEKEAAAPTLTPPAIQAITEGAVGAAVWSQDKRVNGLYTTFHARNTWMSIAGVGWKRLANTNDSASETMTMLAAHCREKACRIDFAEDGGIIREVYVW